MEKFDIMEKFDTTYILYCFHLTLPDSERKTEQKYQM